MALCQGRRHAGIPRGLIAGRRELGHKKQVALRVHGDEAQAAGKRVVLGHREVFVRHAVGQAYGFMVVVGHHRLCTVEMDLLLSPIGGRNKAVKACQIEEETDQAQAACPDFAADEMAGHHDAVEARQAGTALQAVGDVGTTIESVLPKPPGLQRRSGNRALFGGLTLGDALSSPRSVLFKAVRACESIPAWLTVMVALWRVLDDGSHRALLGPSLAFA